MLLNWIILLLPVGYLWYRLIYNLWPAWMTDPQYAYGLLVPMLCAGLFIRRWAEGRQSQLAVTSEESKKLFTGLFASLAFLYLPVRLVEAAVPEWRFIQWLLGGITVGLTLCIIRLGMGRGWLRQLMFPVCFFLVAIPWPTMFEIPIIQTLTHVSVTIVSQLLFIAGVPAIVHGNIIELGTGMVGVEEACSGIRSFQTSLMTSLFFGEFYRLRPAGRCWLIPIGFILAICFNIGRMFFLTMVAAKRGVAAISHYHDPAGVSTAIFCTLVLWGVAFILSRRPAYKPTPAAASAIPSSSFKGGSAAGHFLICLGSAMLIWLIITEVGVQTWYNIREAHLKPGPDWTLNFPEDNPTMKNLVIDETTKNLLRYDNGKEAAWTGPNETQWHAFYFNWQPGRVAGYLAKRHTPEICLPAIGLKLVSGPKLDVVNINGVDLPIRCYVFSNQGQAIQVFHCRWEAGISSQEYVQNDSARLNLIRAVWTGRGKEGQKVFEFVITGMTDSQQAKTALINELQKLIVVKKTSSAS